MEKGLFGLKTKIRLFSMDYAIPRKDATIRNHPEPSGTIWSFLSSSGCDLRSKNTENVSLSGMCDFAWISGLWKIDDSIRNQKIFQFGCVNEEKRYRLFVFFRLQEGGNKRYSKSNSNLFRDLPYRFCEISRIDIVYPVTQVCRRALVDLLTGPG